MSVDEILVAVQPRVAAWAGQELRVSELSGGMTNRNYRVEADGVAYVLRLGGNDTHLLGIDRRVEHAANQQAARLGIAPQVVAFLQPEEYLVTRFVHGRPISPAAMREPEVLARVLAALRRFHEGAPIPGSFSALRVAESYAELAQQRGVALPAQAPPALAQARRIEAALYGSSDGQVLRPCHNDLLNANFLEEDGQVRILDWEYAGMGDRYFDLANFSANHQFDETEDRELLTAYFNVPPDQARFARLRLMRIMSNLREAMWGVVQQGISRIDFDFVGYAADYFARLSRDADDPRFEGWLQEVRTG